jgi:signal transduction histidine kinase
VVRLRATTAYFVASEAVANAVKHARANRIDLHVAQADGGLTGMVDRVAAAGGLMSLTRPATPPG